MTSLLLANGRIVNEGRIQEVDLLIVDDRLARIGAGPLPARTRVVDLHGLHVLPGIIDDQVHFREPGLTHKATIASESQAAICGGVTSYLDMPNNSPPCIDRAGLAAKKAIAARTSFANYGFYLGATNTNIEEIRAVTRADARQSTMVARCVRQISPASCSTEPGCGKCCVNSRCACATTRPAASNSSERELVVPWSSARMNWPVIPGASIGVGQALSPRGLRPAAR